MEQGDIRRARALLSEGLTVADAMGDIRSLSSILGELGRAHLEEGDTSAAKDAFERASAIRREIGDKLGSTKALIGLIAVALQQGDPAAAREYALEFYSLAGELNNTQLIVDALSHLALVEHALGDDSASAVHLAESMALNAAAGERIELSEGLARTLAATGAILAARLAENPASGSVACLHAAQLFGKAEALRETANTPPTHFEQRTVNDAATLARLTLGDDAFATAWAEGRALTWEQAARLALGKATSA
jgi:tetratricopeptide (TPR) repeat protein